MQIKSQFTNFDGKISYVIYNDDGSFEHLLSKKVTQTYGICFYKDYKQYFNWGEIGERIIKRALELKDKL